MTLGWALRVNKHLVRIQNRFKHKQMVNDGYHSMMYSLMHRLHFFRMMRLLSLLVLVFGLASCSSSSKKKGPPRKLKEIKLQGSSSTPPHRMSREEYPFDADGTYRPEWAAGRGGATVPADQAPEEEESVDVADVPPSAPVAKVSSTPLAVANPYTSTQYYTPQSTRTSNAGGGTSYYYTQQTPSYQQAPTGGGGGDKKTTTSSKPKPAAVKTKSIVSKPKPKPKTVAAKPKPKPVPARKHTVKESDTLWGLSKKYGTTVAKIKAANGLNSDLLRNGRVLTIPR
jgi:LysM repeat protein